MLISFPSLEQFDSVFARETYTSDRRIGTYNSKIKLHGMNIGIRISPDGTVALQGRRGDIGPEDAAYGLRDFLERHRAAWAIAAGKDVTTVFGEWAGPQIAKGDAIQRTDRKRFFIFAIGIGAVPHPQFPEKTIPEWVITEPEAIRKMMPAGLVGDEIRVLPWESRYDLQFDFSNEKQVGDMLDILNHAVEGVAKVDPYVARNFGIEAPGEGYVQMRRAAQPGELSGVDFARTTFKAKTEKHRVKKQAKPATTREALPDSAEAFLDIFCTPQRLAQAVEEVSWGVADMRDTGKVISWMQEDVLKEASAEIEALGIAFEKLKPAIAGRVRAGLKEMVAAKVQPAL